MATLSHMRPVRAPSVTGTERTTVERSMPARLNDFPDAAQVKNARTKRPSPIAKARFVHLTWERRSTKPPRNARRPATMKASQRESTAQVRPWTASPGRDKLNVDWAPDATPSPNIQNTKTPSRMSTVPTIVARRSCGVARVFATTASAPESTVISPTRPR